MLLKDLCLKLDDKFNIKSMPPDMPFSVVMPKIYKENDIPLEKYLNQEFMKTWHGLMLQNSDTVDSVLLSVFLSGEILDKIFNTDKKNILIFCHHPMEMETSNRGFLPLSELYLQKMKQYGMSAYILHTPLDVHKKICTSCSIANSLNLNARQKFDKNSIGYSGVIGELPKKVQFNNFIKTLKNLFNIEDIHFVKKFNSVFKIGIIAGGGSDPKYALEAMNLGCDTYLTGDYVNKINNEYGNQERQKFKSAKNQLNINLIECSHYATEKLVLVNEIKEFFEGAGIKTAFIEQEDSWH